ncbi:uncharacterized protein LOC123704731 isoform X2 [Colias croceus]|uniref:uncharacterized protein LOC123704731 isoform X2 n=1 Tax=Colias crocea TaxID=72248 RepID=UPI001E281AA0|nr:uncharacterized protein LOC123704731 isoform X2 [Colias croceus]
MFRLAYYIVIALPLILATQIHFNNGLDCKKIKCPLKEDPVCVKVYYKKANKTKTYHVIAFNECEVGYIKCHADLKASIVPMRNCDHSIEHSNNITKSKFRKRAKRQVTTMKFIQSTHKAHKIAGRADYHYGDRVSSSDEDTPTEVNQKLTMKHDVASHEVVNIGHNDPTEQNLENDNIEKEGDKTNASDETVTNTHENKQDELDQPNDSKNAMVELESNSVEKTEKPKKSDEMADNVEKTKEEKQEIQSSKSKERYEDHRYSSEETKLGHNDKIVKDVPDDYDKIKETNVDMDEYNKDCPTICPSRDIMLCARCNHGVYRTFMSVCHLRVFACKHSDEKLTLVSRKPCVQSAPFLTDMPDPEGRISEPGDRDPVLQFIVCRAKGLLKKGDPKCTFDDV